MGGCVGTEVLMPFLFCFAALVFDTQRWELVSFKLSTSSSPFHIHCALRQQTAVKQMALQESQRGREPAPGRQELTDSALQPLHRGKLEIWTGTCTERSPSAQVLGEQERSHHTEHPRVHQGDCVQGTPEPMQDRSGLHVPEGYRTHKKPAGQQNAHRILSKHRIPFISPISL